MKTFINKILLMKSKKKKIPLEKCYLTNQYLKGKKTKLFRRFQLRTLAEITRQRTIKNQNIRHYQGKILITIDLEPFKTLWDNIYGKYILLFLFLFCTRCYLHFGQMMSEISFTRRLQGNNFVKNVNILPKFQIFEIC